MMITRGPIIMNGRYFLSFFILSAFESFLKAFASTFCVFIQKMARITIANSANDVQLVRLGILKRWEFRVKGREKWRNEEDCSRKRRSFWSYKILIFWGECWRNYCEKHITFINLWNTVVDVQLEINAFFICFFRFYTLELNFFSLS